MNYGKLAAQVQRRAKERTVLPLGNKQGFGPMVGSFNMNFIDLTISGDGHTKYINNGTDSLNGSHATIDTNVLGHGTFAVIPHRDSKFSHQGFLELGGLVSRGQSVELTGSGPGFREVNATVKIDDPGEFLWDSRFPQPRSC